MRQLDLTREDYGHAVNYRDEHYCRNVLKVGPGYSALILCWKDGQGTPIHDHRGSACGVRVLEGEVIETTYVQSEDGSLTQDRQLTYEQGLVCGSYDDDTHTLQNLQNNGRETITMHVYTPPMMNYRVWNMATGEVCVCRDEETLAAQRREGLVPA